MEDTGVKFIVIEVMLMISAVSLKEDLDGLIRVAGHAEEIRKVSDTEARDALASLLIQRLIDESPLLLLQFDNAIFNGFCNQNAMNLDRSGLSDAMSTINSLFLYSQSC